MLGTDLSKACSIDDGLDVVSLTEVNVMLIDGTTRETHTFLIVIVELQPGVERVCVCVWVGGGGGGEEEVNE